MNDNNIRKYKYSTLKQILSWIGNYELGEDIAESIRFTRFRATDIFADNLVAGQDKAHVKDGDFLFNLCINPIMEIKLKKYLLRQKKVVLKHMESRGCFIGSHLYQLYLQYLPQELNDMEKRILLDNYITTIKDLKGEDISVQKRKCLEEKMHLQKIY